MTSIDNFSTVYSDGDIDTNRSDNPSLTSLVEARYSRRHTMFSGLAAMTTAVFSSSLLAACGGDGGDGDYLNVDAGQDGQTSSGRIVTISGTSSGDIASTQWTQTGGASVAFGDPAASSISFTAPSVGQSSRLTFRLTVTGANGRINFDETTITVDPARLGFTAVPKNLNDVVTVPTGYTVTVLYRLGDPTLPGVSAYANNGSDGDFDKRAGDHHDALYYFGLAATGNAPDPSNSSRGLLVMNHENITQSYLHPNGPTTATPRPEAEVLKEINAHGVSVIEVSRSGAGAWSYNQNSAINRRVTPMTPMRFNGPVRGDAQLRTAFSPVGTDGRGTINNCANGFTQWNTSLTCEENWAGYFRRPASDTAGRSAGEIASLARYGVTSGSGNYNWSTVVPQDPASTVYRRWDARVTGATAADDFRNEPNQFGWVVEMDPYDSASVPRKRTALGRFGHEGAWPGKFVAGVRPAIYMGDDNRGDYFYKFVSATPWAAGDAQAADRLATGDKYLDNGTLYVARFNADGTGQWIALVFGQNGLTAGSAFYPFSSQADVLIHTRLAGDQAGATKMDRPEWTATNPVNGEIYLTLTNNNATVRPLNGTDAANPRHYNDPKGSTNQFGNPNGHVIRIREDGDTTEAAGFRWDIYVFGAGSDLNPTNVNISVLDDTNDFSSPDGLWFSRSQNAGGLVTPILWIQTDDGAYTDVTNNQMLAAMPGRVGDGSPVTITNVGQNGMAQQQTIVGRAPGTSLRRFMVGPKECEITGVDSTPDGRALFVNIQHPGENGGPANITSHWPQSQSGNNNGRPRSATIVVTKDDGGVVGL